MKKTKIRAITNWNVKNEEIRINTLNENRRINRKGNKNRKEGIKWKGKVGDQW